MRHADREPVSAYANTVSIASDLRSDFHPIGFSNKAVVVRSSALDEDGSAASFAGLHESFVNIRGVESILKHVHLVWASLWSDAALLYRQEIGLSVEKSAMAVVVQELIAGERSGVAFTRNPNAASQGVVESVHGLNQGLVDGIVEPDRWILDRKTREIISHTPAQRNILDGSGQRRRAIRRLYRSRSRNIRR